MDEREVVWERSNLQHVLEAHPERQLTQHEIEEALMGPHRVESSEVRRGTTYHAVVGASSRGRLLAIVWVDHPEGRFPVHARQAGRRAGRRYYR